MKYSDDEIIQITLNTLNEWDLTARDCPMYIPYYMIKEFQIEERRGFRLANKMYEAKIVELADENYYYLNDKGRHYADLHNGWLILNNKNQMNPLKRNELIKEISEKLIESTQNTTEINSILRGYEIQKNLLSDSVSSKRNYLKSVLGEITNQTIFKIATDYGIASKYAIEIEDKTIMKQNEKKVFISHSSKDNEQIKPLIDLIENIGVPHSQIFYSSHPAYGVGLGEDIFTRLKTELEDNVFALFMLSDNFYKSPVCLCEMGAIWIKSNKQIPILIPPFSFSSIQGVFPNSLGFHMNDKNQLNNFKSELESYFKLTPIHISRWEEKRDEYLLKVNNLLK